MKSISIEASRMSEHGISSALWGVAVMGCDWGMLSPSTRALLLGICERGVLVGREDDVPMGDVRGYTLALQALAAFNAPLQVDSLVATMAIQAVPLLVEQLPADGLVDLFCALFTLNVFESAANRAVETQMLSRLKSVYSTIAPAKLHVLSGVLQKIASRQA